ncbi:hypothetical protein HDU88_007612 [Geranomyces variabilis]|nr:hypothetical protein HDU88_007612 [Geranomyces variabilis]
MGRKERLHRKRSVRAELPRRLRQKIRPTQFYATTLPSSSVHTQKDKQKMDPPKIEFVESETVYPPRPTTTFTSVWVKPRYRVVEPVSPADSSEDKPNEPSSSPAAESDSTDSIMVQDSVAGSPSPFFSSEGFDDEIEPDYDSYDLMLDVVDDRGIREESCTDSARGDQEQYDIDLSDEHFDMGTSDDELAIVMESHESATQEAQADEPQNAATAAKKSPISNKTEAEYVLLIEQRIDDLRQDVDEKLLAHKTELQARDAEIRFRGQLDALALLLNWADALVSSLGEYKSNKSSRAELKAFLHHAIERVCFLVEVPDSLLFNGQFDLTTEDEEINLFHDPQQPSELDGTKLPDFCKRQRILASLLKHAVAVIQAHENGDVQDNEVRATAGFLAGQISLKVKEGQERSAKSLVALMEKVLARPDLPAHTKTKLARQVSLWNRKIDANRDAVEAHKATVHMSAERLKPVWQSWQQEGEIEREHEQKLSRPDDEPNDTNSDVEMTDVSTTTALGKRKLDATDTEDEVAAPTGAETDLVTPPARTVAKKQKNDTFLTSSVTNMLGYVVGRSVAALTFSLVGWFAANEEC